MPRKLVAAIVDRVTFDAHILETGTPVLIDSASVAGAEPSHSPLGLSHWPGRVDRLTGPRGACTAERFGADRGVRVAWGNVSLDCPPAHPGLIWLHVPRWDGGEPEQQCGVFGSAARPTQTDCSLRPMGCAEATPAMRGLRSSMAATRLIRSILVADGVTVPLTYVDRRGPEVPR